MNRLRSILTIAAFLLTATPAAVRADTSGTWALTPSAPLAVQLKLQYGSDGTDSHSFALADLKGLSWQDLASHGPVHFTIVREAGTLTCSGNADHGRAGGTFTFTPDNGYRSSMASLGFGSLSDNELLTAAMLDITTAYTKSMVEAGYTGEKFSGLIPLRALNVDAAYVRQMRAVVASHQLPFSDLIPLRALHVDAAYVDSLASLGYTNLRPGQLIQLKAMNIDATYIAKVKAHGIKNASIDDLVRLKAMNII
jgi:hypothetical protein